MRQPLQPSSLAPLNRVFIFMRIPLAATPVAAPASNAPPGSEWRDLLWIALIIIPTLAELAHSAQ